jgi:hypothetical protein
VRIAYGRTRVIAGFVYVCTRGALLCSLVHGWMVGVYRKNEHEDAGDQIRMQRPVLAYKYYLAHGTTCLYSLGCFGG